MKYYVFIILVCFSLVLTACTTSSQTAQTTNTQVQEQKPVQEQTQEEPVKTPEPVKTEVKSETTKFEGEVLAGTKTPLMKFTQKDYETALATKKVIFLYFYPDWCTSCRSELIQLKEAFNGMENDAIVGFVVDYDGTSADNNEVALAEKFSVKEQKTKIVLKDGKEALKVVGEWRANVAVTQITQFL